jgi:hypothetical protein
MNGKITHCYYSGNKLNINLGTKIYSCNPSGIGDEIIDIVDKTKIISAIRVFFDGNEIK